MPILLSKPVPGAWQRFLQPGASRRYSHEHERTSPKHLIKRKRSLSSLEETNEVSLAFPRDKALCPTCSSVP